jgi:hypothetical protein
VAIALHTYKNTPLQSNRWDLVLKLPAGKALSATPFFDILGFKVMASWPGSDKACPQCKLVGHDSRSCPKCPTKASKKHSSSTTKQSATSAETSATLGIASTSSSAAPRGSTAEKDTPISDLTSDDTALMDTEGYQPYLTPSQKRKQKRSTQSSSSSPLVPLYPIPNPNPSLPAFPFDLSPEHVEHLSTVTTEEWMDVSRKAQAEMNDPEVDEFMASPPEHIIASFKNAIEYFQRHPIPPKQ